MEYLLFSAYIGFITDIYLKRHMKLLQYPHTALFSVLICIAFLAAFDSPIQIVKGCLFIQFLVIAGFWDQKTHEIPDWLPICVAMCGLINFRSADSFLGALLVFAVLMVSALLWDSFGGGDIKLLTACGLTLGVHGAMISSIASLFLFTIFHFKKADRNNRFPLAPFIAVGSFLAFLIT